MDLKRVLNFSWLILFAALSFNGLAADDTKLTKSINKRYKVSPNVNIDIDNKYGQVIVNTWSQDSVVVNIEITAFGRKDSDTQKTLNRVDFDFNQVSNFLTIHTVFDRSTGTFKELFNSIGDYSKSLLSKNKLQIDYEIFIPEKSLLDIENKFGNVYINQHEGRLKLVMSHGDFKANNLTGNSSIELSFGNASIKNLQDGELKLRASDVEIQKTANLSLVSSSSEIEINEAFSVKVDSRNDKIEIDKLQVMQGKGVFTKMKLGDVESLIDLELSYGEIRTGLVMSKFSKVEIESRSTDIDLVISDRSSFRALWVARDGNLKLDQVFTDFKKAPHDDKKGFIVITGDYGTGSASEVTIKAQGGDVSIQLSEETLSTLK